MSDIDKIKKLLKAATAGLTEEERQQAILVAEYIKFMHGGKDYEGKQTFLAEDYSRRN